MKKTMIGIVTSTKMQKTVVVNVDRLWKHPIYKKAIKRSKKYLAEDLIGVKEGNTVKIEQTRTLSKRKCWKVLEVITK
jgi:small subunit ribosomal protein S17